MRIRSNDIGEIYGRLGTNTIIVFVHVHEMIKMKLTDPQVEIWKIFDCTDLSAVEKVISIFEQQSHSKKVLFLSFDALPTIKIPNIDTIITLGLTKFQIEQTLGKLKMYNSTDKFVLHNLRGLSYSRLDIWSLKNRIAKIAPRNVIWDIFDRDDMTLFTIETVDGNHSAGRYFTNDPEHIYQDLSYRIKEFSEAVK